MGNNGINGRFEWCGDLKTLHQIEEKDILPLVRAQVAFPMHIKQPHDGLRVYTHRYRVLVGEGFPNIAPSVRVEFFFNECTRMGRVTVGRNGDHVKKLYARLCR